jgi:hypothetical protein
MPAKKKIVAKKSTKPDYRACSFYLPRAAIPAGRYNFQSMQRFAILKGFAPKSFRTLWIISDARRISGRTDLQCITRGETG